MARTDDLRLRNLRQANLRLSDAALALEVAGAKVFAERIRTEAKEVKSLIAMRERELANQTDRCLHCGRTIINEGGKWIDPEAPTTPEEGDDHIWRETCDAHDTFTAEHEPMNDANQTPTSGKPTA